MRVFTTYRTLKIIQIRKLKEPAILMSGTLSLALLGRKEWVEFAHEYAATKSINRRCSGASPCGSARADKPMVCR